MPGRRSTPQPPRRPRSRAPRRTGRASSSTGRSCRAVNLVEGVGEEVLRVARREVESRGGRRVEAVDVVEFDRVETLARAQPDPLVEHGLERVELPEVDPALL